MHTAHTFAKRPGATMLLITAAFALCSLAVVGRANAGDELVIKTSRLSVKETIDAVAATLAEKGIAIAARIDHAAGAKAAGLSLPPTELLIFGNPKLGTPLMQTAPTVGLELPMKVLAWQEADGTVKIAYTAPDALARRHGITGQEKILETMTKALDGFTKPLVR